MTAFILGHLVLSHLLSAAGGFVFHVAWRRLIGPALGKAVGRLISNLF